MLMWRRKIWAVLVLAGACGPQPSLGPASDDQRPAGPINRSPTATGYQGPSLAMTQGAPQATGANTALLAERPPPNEEGPCFSGGLIPGTHTFTLEHDGKERAYDVFVPSTHDDSEPVPVVFYFHPLLMSKAYLQRVGTTEHAEQEGYVSVYADGLNSSWNAGHCCGPSNGAGLRDAQDDVGFVRLIVESLPSVLCVDEDRVYATGFSNGGFLAYRLACEASDLFAAIAPISSVDGMEVDDCAPARPIPVFAINGTNDNLVPYEGGFSLSGITEGEFRSVEETFALWSERGGCTGEARVDAIGSDVTCATHEVCDAGVEVTQCTVQGGGHCWFGEPICFLGTNNRQISATVAGWEFLERFRRP